MAAATVSSPKTSPQRLKALFELTTRLAPLVSGGHQLEEQVGGLTLEGDVAHLINDDQRKPSQAA